MMSVMEDNQQEVEERVIDDNTIKDDNENEIENSITMATMSRKEKRKALKKMRRKQVRKEIAKKEREEEEARMNDPEEQMRLLRLEQEEAERMAKERKEFEERERQFLRALELQKKKQEEEDEERRKLEEEESQKELANNENASEANEDDDWEYIEEGPAEIIWKGNEIIVKKKKIRVPKKAPDALKENQESERPISNPLAPQSEAFEDYRSAKEVLESIAQQVPNFGTEQDKAHCPFHLKTGVCRFGARCSRVHFYPDKACTILIKNMYNGPGLSWEQDEGLEHTEEEVKQSFEDFYEDVHTEFLKFGELVNFKVCKNGSSHLRGNVYVHYKSFESAMLAYQSTNGRYFAGKLLTCEFINVTRWRVAICGEYMKSKFKSCSRGSACNFIHCFQNPGRDYEWADWDKPAPRYWLEKMASLFGYTGDDFPDEVGLRHHSRRSRSRGLDSPHRKNFSDEDDGYNRRHGRDIPHRGDGRETSILDRELQEERKTYQDYRRFKHSETDNVDGSDGSTDDHRNVVGINASSKGRERERMSTYQDNKSRKVEAIKRYHSRRSRSRGLDSPLRKSCSDEDDGCKRRRRKHSPHRRDDRVSDNLDWEMQEDRRTYRDSRCFKHSEADNVDVSEGSIDGQRSVAGIKRSSKKRERERLFADQDCRSKRVEVISFKVESAEGGVSDRYVEQRSRSSSRQKRVAQSAHDCRHKKGDKSDVGKSRGEKNHDEFHRYEDKSLSAKKNEAGSLNYNSHGDSQDSEEDEHYCRSKKKSRMKDEAESSSSDSQCSDDSRLVKGEKRHHKKRRKRSRFKNKTSDVEIRCDGDSLEGYERKQHRHRENKPRELNIFSESADGRGKLDRDDKRPQKTERKKSRLKNRSGFADTESGLEDDRHHRHSKHSRHVINDNESSDGDKLGKYEKRSHKSVRTRSRSRSKKESELADTKRNTKRVDEEDGHKSAEHHVKEPGLSEVDSNAYRGLFEVDAGNSVSNDRYRNSHAYLEANHHSEQENTGYRYCGTHDQNVQSDFMNPDVQGEILCRSRDGDKLYDLSNRDSASENDHKRLDEECILQVDRSNEKGTASGMVATSLVHTSHEGIDNDAKVELEKACRLAALKKLEEIRMKKDTQVSHSREPIEGLKDCSEENMHGRVLKKADSSKLEICDTSVKRRRI